MRTVIALYWTITLGGVGAIGLYAIYLLAPYLIPGAIGVGGVLTFINHKVGK